MRRKVRAVFRYWIWMLVLVKLVLPPSLGSPVSVGTWFGDRLEVPASAILEPEPQPAALSPVISAILSAPEPGIAEPIIVPSSATIPAAPVETVKPQTPIQTPAVPLSWQGLVLLVWAVVVLALTSLLIQRAFFVRGLLGQSEEAGRSMLNELENCRRCLGLSRRIGLRLSPNATSPAVCGLFRPVILIPQSIAPRLQSHDLQAVLLHELAHVKRGDLWINLVQTLLQIAYFYNPLLWLANAMIRRTREQAVDETVLVAMGETARQYPQILVNIAKLAFTRPPTLSLRLIGVVESKSALTARIKHILTRPLPKTARLGLFGLLIILASASVLLPMAGPKPGIDSVSVREVMLPDVESKPMMLDLATGALLLLPQAESPDEIWRAIGKLGRGDLVYDSNALILVRDAASNQAHAGPTPPFKTYEIKPPLPAVLTVTTAEGARFEVTVLAVDEEGCTLKCALSSGVETEVQSVTGSKAADDASVREIVLPELDERPVVLDLATGELVSLPAGPEPQKVQQALRELGKGDILYDVDLGDRTLIFLRDARSEPAGDETGEPSVTGHLIRNLPETITVTTKEGRQYKVTILAADEESCTLEYSQIPADRSVSGGAPVEPEKTAGVLEFRIAPETGDLDSEVLARHRREAVDDKPVAEDEFAWFPVRTGVTGSPGAIVREHEGKTYVLLWNKPPGAVLSSPDWGLESVYKTTDANGRPAIGLTLDDKGASLFHQVTALGTGQLLATVVEGTVVSMPRIIAPLDGRTVLIVGNFTEQEVDGLIAALRQSTKRGLVEPGMTRILQANSDQWTIVDLATGTLISSTRSLSTSEIQQGLREVGKGDLAYDVRNGDRLLLFLRGATSQQSQIASAEPWGAQAYRIGSSLPQELTVTTAEGGKYKVTILAADEKTCTLKLPLPPGKSDDAELEIAPAVLSSTLTPDSKSITTTLPNGVTVSLLGFFKGWSRDNQ
ncbi:MAG: M56 family metallopeptidase, partial [Solirubrobacterales bacterium]